jgi:hypothetical protein
MVTIAPARAIARPRRPSDAIERQLAHQEANKIRGAYTMPPNSVRSAVRMMR